jgi:type I restriction enzyme M protein
VCDELLNVYGDPTELAKYARVAPMTEVLDNEFNLNVPRYVDTFEPEARLEVADALAALREAEATADVTDAHLNRLLNVIGYAD